MDEKIMNQLAGTHQEAYYRGFTVCLDQVEGVLKHLRSAAEQLKEKSPHGLDIYEDKKNETTG